MNDHWKDVCSKTKSRSKDPLDFGSVNITHFLYQTVKWTNFITTVINTVAQYWV